MRDAAKHAALSERFLCDTTFTLFLRTIRGYQLTPRPPDRHKNTAKRREQKRKSAPMTVQRMEKFVKRELEQQQALVKRPPGRPKGATAFQRVIKAREILAQSAPMAARLLTKAAKVASAKGDSGPAEFLLKHVGAADEHGKMQRPLVSSVDKVEGDGAGNRRPIINIGWIQPATALPPAVHVTEVPQLLGAIDAENE